MKNLLITLPMFLAFTACDKTEDDTGSDDSFSVDEGSSDDDGGGSDDGGGDDGGSDDGGSTGGGGSIDLDAAWAAPGCDYNGVVCMALTGSAFAGAPVADICVQFDEGYADQLGINSTAVEACPQDGANGACELALASGQEQVWFSWPTFDGAGSCNANGGTYVAL